MFTHIAFFIESATEWQEIRPFVSNRMDVGSTCANESVALMESGTGLLKRDK